MSVTSPVLRAALAAVLCGPGAGGIALAASADPVVIEFRDGVVTPQAIELSAGTETTLVLRNAGTTAAEFESKRLKQERAIGPKPMLGRGRGPGGRIARKPGMGIE